MSMSLWTTEREAYVALALVPGIGSARLRTLHAACNSALGALSAPFAFLCSLPGISRAAATAIATQKASVGRRALEQAAALGATVLTPTDRAFPVSLREIPDPPPLLFATGRLELLGRPAVAIVGSRNHSQYGAQVCRMLAQAAASAGIVVVSGMARGLDAVAHDTTLTIGGDTVGVLGNGLGVVYPAANRALYNRVTEAGLLLSEFPPGERPHLGSFPRRNRLISGLCRVTVVVEAAIGSGALITAGAALDQGNDVMAVPGPITSRVSAGSNALIRDGAEPLLDVSDLLAHFSDLAGPAPSRAEAAPAVSPARQLPAGLTDDLRRVARLLSETPLHLDAIAAECGLSVANLLAALCELELAGIVEQQPGRMFKWAPLPH